MTVAGREGRQAKDVSNRKPPPNTVKVFATA